MALVIVKPETVIAWHRRGFRLWWAWKSRRHMGRPTVPADVRTLIRTMAQANPRWGAPRIHGELLKLGLDVCETTVAKYMVRPRQPPSQTWRTFLRNHLGQVVAADFFVVPTVTYRLVFVLVLLAHDRRRIRHVAVTTHPTAAWTAHQVKASLGLRCHCSGNAALAPSDFESFCVTTPLDLRLPSGGGQQVCGLFDLKPSKVGLNNPIVGLASQFGEQFNHWNGVDLTISARLRHGVQVQGGVSGGKTMTDNCGLKNFPEVSTTTDLAVSAAATGALTITSGVTSPTQFCHLETPYRWTAKFFGVYPLPWDFRVSGSIQNLPGPLINGLVVFSSAQVAQSLGRPLSSASSIRVNVVPPGTLFGERTTQLDLRLAKGFAHFGSARVQVIADLYNALNTNSVLTYNDTYGTTGPTWQRPTGIMPSRLAKFGVQVDF
jgi:hypothetical protein